VLVPEEQLRLEEIGDQLRAKIASKFTACSFLAGIAVTVLSIQVSILWQSEHSPRLLAFSIAGMVAAVLLFAGALLAFDALTMPKRFWREGNAPHWAASGHLGYLAPEDLNQLHAQMVYWWVWYAEVATALLGIATLLLLAPLDSADMSRARLESFWGALGGLAAALLYVAAVRFRARQLFPGLIRPVD
jgi:hypothetical protein